MKEIRKVHISVSSNVATSMNKGTVAATGLSTSLKGVATSASLATGGIKAMTMALLSSGVGAIVVAVGSLIAGLGTVIGKSKAFAKELSGLKAILGTDEDPLNIKALSEDAKKLGATTAFTALQVVQLQTEFAKLGFTTDQILNATAATLDLAAAAGTDLAEAAMVAGSTLKGFGLGASETQRVVDVMAKSFSSSALDMNGFAESMKLVAPIAKTVKVPIEQTTAALGLLADNGVKGSLAGTQLRRILGDLAIKTGKSFRESLEDTSRRLEAATSDSEKLAIATELVGDRARGSLIALAENKDKLDELTISLENASGAAKEMAEERLNNLAGDLTRLSSAWEGFILSLDDGEGIITKISRFSIQVLNGLIVETQQGIQKVNHVWNMLGIDFDRAGTWFKKVGNQFSQFVIETKIYALELKEALKDVPFIGDGISDESIAKERAVLGEQLKQTKDRIKELATWEADLVKKKAEEKVRFLKQKFGISTRELTDEEIRIRDIFRAGEAKKEDDARKKALADKIAFLAKLKKLEEDTEDTTELERIERKRERHLAELDTIKMNAVEREEAILAINNIYDLKRAEQRAKNLEKFNKMFGDDLLSPLDKIERDREAHLLELDALEISETEKEELKLRIRKHYDALKDVATATNLEKKKKDILDQLKEDQALRDGRIQLMYSTLDTAAKVAGEETAIAKALMALKMVMQLKELGMKMGIIKDELAVKASAAMTEAGIEGAKVGTATAQGMAETSKIGFPWNVITMAGYALQAAMLVKTFATQKKKLGNIAGAAGGASGGGATVAPSSPPSFNVIGGTSAGDELVASTIAGVNSNVMRAYVVSSDISSAQELQRNTETIASVGG